MSKRRSKSRKSVLTSAQHVMMASVLALGSGVTWAGLTTGTAEASTTNLLNEAFITSYNSGVVDIVNLSNDTVQKAAITVGSEPNSAAFNPNGTQVWITNRASGTVSVINPTTNQVVKTLTVGSQPHGVAFNSDGTTAYVANSGGNSISVINTSTWSTKTITTSGYPVQPIVVGSTLYVTDQNNNELLAINTTTDTISSTIPLAGTPYGMSLNPAGTYLYVALQSTGQVAVVKLSDNTVVTNITVGSYPSDTAVSPDGNTVYVANSSSSSISVIDAATNTVTHTITVGVGPYVVGVSSDGTHVYAVNYISNSMSVIDSSTNTVVDTIGLSNGPFMVGTFMVPTYEAASFTATVNAATPNITTQPQGANVNVGQSSPTLSVSATVSDGGTLSYQWYKNTTNSNSGGTAISGATSATYRAPTTTAATTFYYAVVTNTNNSVSGTKSATVTSTVAKVAVTRAQVGNIPMNVSSTQVNGGQTITVSGVVYDVYHNFDAFVPVNLTANIGDFVSSGSNTQTVTTNVYGQFSTQWTAPSVTQQTEATVTASVYGTTGGNTTLSIMPPVPNAPNALSASDVTKNSLVLSWNPVSGADTYNVYENGVRIGSNLASTSDTIDGLSAGTSYMFTVTAVNGAGESSQSTPLFTATAASPAPVQSPTGTQSNPPSPSPKSTKPTPLSVTSPSVVKPGQPGQPYQQTLVAVGGTGKYTWKIVTGNLPAGFTLNSSTGVISGTTDDKSPHILTVTATDSNGVTQTKQIVVDSVPSGEREVVWKTNDLHAANIPNIVVAHSANHSTTTYLPIWYVGQILQTYGINAHWNGQSWALTSKTAPSNLHPSHLSGSHGVYLNGKLVDKVNPKVAVDPYTKKNTVFLPRWYLQFLLNRLHIKNTWNGTTWTIG